MPEDISLLPREVEKARAEEARGRSFRKGSLVFLAVSLLLGAGVFIYSLVLQNQLSNLEKNILNEESKISSLLEIELQAHDLEARTKVLGEVFRAKTYFSTLLSTFSQAVPTDVSLTEMTVPSAETVSVSGTSRSYPSLSKFLLNLEAAGLFETVGLRSVSLDEQTGEAKFDVNLTINKGGLGQ